MAVVDGSNRLRLSPWPPCSRTLRRTLPRSDCAIEDVQRPGRLGQVDVVPRLDADPADDAGQAVRADDQGRRILRVAVAGVDLEVVAERRPAGRVRRCCRTSSASFGTAQ